MRSPVTNSENCFVIDSIDCKDVIDMYECFCSIDVSKAFLGLNSIQLYKCFDSGYEFFYPFEIAGGSELYEDLSKFQWYYLPWKWEHAKSLPFVEEAKNILEIGCGTGTFLSRIAKKYPGNTATGLEITRGKYHFGNIINETIQQHAHGHREAYDLVCSYQVLEHITDVRSFLSASLDVLKVGGKLIISVPNNNSVLFKGNKDAYLNMPPHHMGRWSSKSLEFLTRIFPMTLVSKFYEPIQDYHLEFFKSVLRKRIRRFRNPVLEKLSYNNNFLSYVSRIAKPFYKGHSVMFVYEKT